MDVHRVVTGTRSPYGSLRDPYIKALVDHDLYGAAPVLISLSLQDLFPPEVVGYPPITVRQTTMHPLAPLLATFLPFLIPVYADNFTDLHGQLRTAHCPTV